MQHQGANKGGRGKKAVGSDQQLSRDDEAWQRALAERDRLVTRQEADAAREFEAFCASELDGNVRFEISPRELQGIDRMARLVSEGLIELTPAQQQTMGGSLVAARRRQLQGRHLKSGPRPRVVAYGARGRAREHRPAATRRAATRSSAASGDSGDDDPPGEQLHLVDHPVYGPVNEPLRERLDIVRDRLRANGGVG